MIRFEHQGNFNGLEKFLMGAMKLTPRQVLERYGQKGVLALSAATPKDTSETANSWSYEIETTPTGYKIIWSNSASNEGIPIVILLQYGHVAQNGTYVQGRDFINPAMQPIIDSLSDSLWTEVSNL